VGRGEHVEDLVHEAGNLGRLQPPPLALPAGVQRLALEQVHDEEHRAVLGDVVVEDADGAGVLDAVRGVALAQEALLDALVARELAVQDLHGDPVGVAQVGRCVDGSHAAGAEHTVEAVLGLENGAYPFLRTRDEIVLPFGHGDARKTTTPPGLPKPASWGPGGDSSPHGLASLILSRRVDEYREDPGSQAE
jgi:hypothetical protein